MTQHLTLREVKQACRAALADGTLLALHPEAVPIMYQVGRFRCAIGCALSEETLSEIRASATPLEGADITALECAGIITFASDEARALSRLQLLHDLWFAYQDDEGERIFLNALVPIEGERI